MEIGSEFWDVPSAEKKCNIWPEHMQWYLCGRSALQAVIKDLDHVRSVAMPSWCCHTMAEPFTDAGVRVHFYPVYVENGMLIQEPGRNCDALFLMDYFGYTAPEPDLSSYKGIVIRDVTHSIFSSSYRDADYYFGSLRKWCGVWTGGYAWTEDGHPLSISDSDNRNYIELRKQAMESKASYIGKGTVQDKGYLEVYAEAENLLERAGIALASDRDVSLAQMLDTGYIISRRRANAKILMEEFSDWLIFPELKDKDCPMFVPILVPDGKRNALRQHLIKNEIYCPIHWPVGTCHKLNEKEKSVYDNGLSLVCDQRYSVEDMNHMVRIIREFQEV